MLRPKQNADLQEKLRKTMRFSKDVAPSRLHAQVSLKSESTLLGCL